MSSSHHLDNNAALERYYRLHASIYDLTRWSFLFGRKKIIELAAHEIIPKTILEVGCGTGKNLVCLHKHFPSASITGVDLSSDMLNIADKKIKPYSDIEVKQKKYDRPLLDPNGEPKEFDLILFSYALSMFNPGWQEAIEVASDQLNQGGIIAVVDFHNSRFAAFRKWMRVNHVRMEGHLQSVLEYEFTPLINKSSDAYIGIWQYLYFIGKKK